MDTDKQSIAKSIRENILKGSGSYSVSDTANENLQAIKDVMNVAVSIEEMSDDQGKFFEQIISLLQELPLSDASRKKQNEELADIIAREIGKNTNNFNEKTLAALRDLGSGALERAGSGNVKPETFIEKVLNKQFGIKTSTLRDRGLVSAFGEGFSSDRRKLGLVRRTSSSPEENFQKIEQETKRTNEILQQIKEATQEEASASEKQTEILEDTVGEDVNENLRKNEGRVIASILPQRSTSGSDVDQYQTQQNPEINVQGGGGGGLLSSVLNLSSLLRGPKGLLRGGANLAGRVLGGVGRIGARAGGIALGAGAAIAGGASRLGGAADDVAETALKSGGGLFSRIGRGGAGIASKIGGKLTGTAAKTALKKVPGIGLILGLGFGLSRIKDGDLLGGALEIASGVASTVPGVGTAASLAIDSVGIARDVTRSDGEGQDIVNQSLDIVEAGIDSAPSESRIAASQEMEQEAINENVRRQNIAPVVNNIDNSQRVVNSTSQQEAQSSVSISVRNTSSSLMRFQDRRMARVM